MNIEENFNSLKLFHNFIKQELDIIIDVYDDQADNTDNIETRCVIREIINELRVLNRHEVVLN